MRHFTDQNKRIVARGPTSKYSIGIENLPKGSTTGIRKTFRKVEKPPADYRTMLPAEQAAFKADWIDNKLAPVGNIGRFLGIDNDIEWQLLRKFEKFQRGNKSK